MPRTQEDFLRNNAFLLYDLPWPRPSTRDPAPRVMKFTIYDSFLDIITLYLVCLDLKKKILKEIMHFHYMTYISTSKHKNPCPGVMKFTIYVDPSLVIISIYLNCLGIENKIFKEIMHFHYITYMTMP